MPHRRPFALPFLLLLAIPLAACGDDGDDDDDDDDDDVTIDAPATEDAAIDGPIFDDALGPDAPEADAAIDSGGGNLAPVINEVTWTPTKDCEPGTTSAFTITLDVTDESPGTLVYSGGAGGCVGTVNTNPDTLSCPNAAPYNGSVTITDDEGLSDTQAITISPCASGSAP